jgi:Carboxypeptidase regulatory-like domain/TonB-dependent Receptor Plug Domain
VNQEAIHRIGVRSLPLASLGAALLLLLPPIQGQERFGTIIGAATDPSKAVLPNVAVTITNKATSRVFTTATRRDGSYTALELEPGRYSVRFEKAGFSRFEIPDVLLLVGRTTRIDAVMQVGTLEQTVQVTEVAPLIDATSTMIAHNVTAEEFDRLPKGRSFQDLAILSTSVNTGEIEGGYQVNGASAAENNFYIDGVSTASLIDGSSRQGAAFEYLQEVQVKTAGLEAEYGGALGGVVSAITKSGGNDWHGEAHYYFYGNRLSASPVKRLQLDPVTEISSAYIQDEKQKRDNQEFGGSLGGPFIKNKLFFFTSVSPRWQRASYDYLFSNGTEPGTMDRKFHAMNWFNKLSFDPSNPDQLHLAVHPAVPDRVTIRL